MSQSNVKNRPNKTAKGFTKHLERREAMGRTRISNPKHPNYNPKEILVTKLIVKGTLDHLAGSKTFYFKKAKIEHPTDKGYFKEGYILNDSGKSRLKTMRNLKRSGLPLWEYMYKVDTL